MVGGFMVTEEINEDDLYFICYMTERVAQAIHQPCSYVVNSIGKKRLHRLLRFAQVSHCENPLKIVDEWVTDYQLIDGNHVINGYPTDLGRQDQEQILLTGTTDYATGIIDFYNQKSTINDKELLEVSKKIVEKNRKAYEKLAKAEL